jgi:hypothetical protein
VRRPLGVETSHVGSASTRILLPQEELQTRMSHLKMQRTRRKENRGETDGLGPLSSRKVGDMKRDNGRIERGKPEAVHGCSVVKVSQARLAPETSFVDQKVTSSPIRLLTVPIRRLGNHLSSPPQLAPPARRQQTRPAVRALRRGSTRIL